ncbi:hypothetical protein N7490_007044 [Penicillium lividum]|nr:hypothetical protein N7490_007044 [Penicillium lividum]
MSDKKQIEDSSTALLSATINGDIDAVKALLDTGEDANPIDELGKTPLHIAAEQGNWEIARLLLERNASPWNSDGTKSVPLHLAAENGHFEVVRLLIESDPKTRNCSNQSGHAPLQLTAIRGDTAMARLILDGRGVLTSTADRVNDTALHEAAKKGHHEICELLIEHDRGIKYSMIERMLGITTEIHMKNVCQHYADCLCCERRPCEDCGCLSAKWACFSQGSEWLQGNFVS